MVACVRLSEEKIWDKAKQRAIDSFTQTMSGFIGRVRKSSLTAKSLEKKVAKYRASSDVEAQFLDLAVLFYADYLDRLQEDGKEDFDGLLSRAIGRGTAGHTSFHRKSNGGDLANLEFVFIDEYQDFSRSFFKIVDGIRKNNPKVKFFCVGDDWQAINGFAGSDLAYFRKFEKRFEDARRLSVSTNYRSAKSIVDLGNGVMEKFGDRPARAQRGAEGAIGGRDCFRRYFELPTVD